MKARDFIAERPCLEEIDGYLHRAVPGVEYEPLTTDDMKLIKTWRQELLDGRSVPAPSRIPRSYTYARGSKPIKKGRK